MTQAPADHDPEDADLADAGAPDPTARESEAASDAAQPVASAQPTSSSPTASEVDDYLWARDAALSDPDLVDDYSPEDDGHLADPDADEEAEDAPAATTAPQAEPAPGQTAPQAGTEEEAAPAQSEPAPPPQFRLRPRSEVGKLAYELLKQDDSLDEETALARAKAQMQGDSGGEIEIDPATRAPEGSPAPASADAGEPRTVEALRARIDRLEDEALRALEEDYDVEAFAKAQRQIRTLKDRDLPELQNAQREAEAAWERAAEASERQVAATYPDALDPQSPFARRMAEIDSAWGEVGDARYFDPSKAEIIAAAVAKELGVAPAGATDGKADDTRQAPVPRSQHVPARAAGGRTPGLASGDMRTHAPADTASTQIDAIASTDDYLAMRERLLAS